MADAISYCGKVISNFMVGFFIVLFTFCLVFIVLSFKLLWELIYHGWIIILIFLLPWLIEFVGMIILKKIAARDHYVYRRR